MNTAQKGFTLIELMIVVAIIGILAAIAIPAYQDYIARSQVSEAFALTAGQKTAIAEYAQINGEYPTETTAPKASELAVTNGTYANSAVTAGTGVITVTMKGAGEVNANVAAGKIFLTPPATLKGSGNTFKFACTTPASGAGAIDVKYLPKDCAAS